MEENHSFLNKIKEKLTFEKAVVRAIMAWLITAVVFYLGTGNTFLGPEYAASINPVLYICMVVILFVSLCALSYFEAFEWVETYGPLLLLTFYGFLTMLEFTDDNSSTKMTYLLVLTIFLVLAIVYAVNKSKRFLVIRNSWSVAVLYVLGALFFIGFFGVHAACRYLTYRAPGYDFGIWVQMFHYMKTSFQPLTTCERSELLSHFAIHFSPAYYLYLPFAILIQTPVTLNVLQVLTIASGLIPVYKLCRRKGLSKAATMLFAVLFTLLPAMGCGTFYDLHENCFLVPFILWLLYFVETDDTKYIVIFGILTCLVKEDAPMYVACIGLYMMLGKKKLAKGLGVSVAAVAYFAIVAILMKQFGAGVMASRFKNYDPNGVGTLWDVIRNVITNPAYVASECFSEDRLLFLMQMFFPLGFIPVVSKHISRFVLLVPIILENLASDWKYQHDIGFQYAFGVAAILIYLAIVNYSELGEKAKHFMAAMAIALSVVFMPVCMFSTGNYFEDYNNRLDYYQDLDEMTAQIPKEASVTASKFFLAHLADRDVIYEYEYVKELDTDYIVLDLRSWSGITEEDIEKVMAAGYEQIKKQDGAYIVFCKENLS